MNYRFLLFIALGLFAGEARAQTDGLSVLMGKLNGTSSPTIEEKIVLNTDKPDYLAGEIIWFKAYCLDAASHRPLDLSKVCYVELLDKDDRFVLQAKIGLKEAEGNGSFYLPLTMVTGNYKLRAYTNWMKNFGPACFFERPVTVINTLKELPSSASGPIVADSSSTLAFFPEGGNLVQGIPSVIGFQLTDAAGMGIDRYGVVIDEHNDTVAAFRPLRCGIGRFSFRPEAGHSYRAMVLLADGTTVVKGLPAAYDRGYVMHVGEVKDGTMNVTVYANHPRGGNIYLFARWGHSYRLARSVRLAQDSVSFLIAADSLREGITPLTLFDGELQPVCERLVFRRPEQRLFIDVTTDKEQYARRDKISLSLSASDHKIRIAGEGDSAAATSMSLSVYRLDSLSSPSGMDMAHYLWMGSDLKGTVESPDYYFTATGPEADEAVDNLMLTHGWRRFRWEQPFREGPPSWQYPPEYIGHIVTGKLADMRTGAPIAHRMVTLSAPGVNYRFRAAITDSAGRMIFDLKDFYGQGGLVVHTGLTADSPAKVDIFSPFSEQFGGNRLPAFSLSETQRQSLLDRNLRMQVQNIYTNDSLQRLRAPLVDTLHFFNKPGYRYKLDDFTRFTTMEEVLREYVLGVNVNRVRGKLHLIVFDDPDRQFFGDDNDLVLLDGVPVPEDKIIDYDPLKVRSLDMVLRKYMLGPLVYSGILSFTTYKGDYEGLELDRHNVLLDYDGLQSEREFYAPRYETDQQKGSRLPDFRTLLFWSPDVHLQGRGKKEYNFFSSDLPGEYLIVVQGISADGQIGYQDRRIEIK
jgi:hypothetical protein